MKVLSIGHANIDLTLFVSEVPPPDGDVKSIATLIGTGGAASNFAVSISRLGERPAVIAVVGDDPLGEFYLRRMEEDGVDVSAVEVASGFATGLVTVINEIGKQRRMISSSGANAKMDSEMIKSRKELIGAADLVHVASLELENVLHVADLRKDLSWDPGIKIAKLGLERLRPVVASTERLFVSGLEASITAGREEPKEAAEFLSALGPSEVVVKLGDQGSVALVEGEFYSVKALSPMVADTTGAGDVFDATYTIARMRGLKPEACLEMANSAAAIKIGRPGTTSGIPTWEEVKALLSFFRKRTG